jgi:mono/diheme cytochrome c family protein
LLRTRFIHLAVVAFVATAAVVAVHGQAPRTVLDGVYTQPQALRGEVEYGSHCAQCHSADLDGAGAAPTLHALDFLDRWRDDHLSTLFLFIRTNMPEAPASGGPGSLSQEQYLDIISYILSKNDFPAGATELKAADLDTTLLVGPDGPQPLPSGATVRVVGCLAHSGDAWTLFRASAPARARKADSTDAAELALSAHGAPGTLEFKLPNLDEDRKAADLEPLIAKRVQVKGVLNGQGASARVSVLSFNGLGADCQ